MPMMVSLDVDHDLIRHAVSSSIFLNSVLHERSEMLSLYGECSAPALSEFVYVDADVASVSLSL